MLTQMRGELERQFQEWASYRLQAIGGIVASTLSFAILMLVFRGMANAQGAVFSVGEISASVLGTVVWNCGAYVMRAAPATIKDEAAQGTLEQVALLPPPFPMIMLMRVIATATQMTVRVTVIMVLLALMFRLPLLPGSVSQLALAMAVYGLTIAGVIGVSLVFGGLAVVYKSVGAIANLVSSLSLFIAGALVPINSLETVFAVLSTIFPMTLGIDVLRLVVIHGAGFGVVGPSMLVLLVQAVVAVGAGVASLSYGVRRSRRHGSLGTY